MHPALQTETLVIRADAGPKMGTGHIMRCIALAQAWREAAGDVVFCGHMGPDTGPHATLTSRLARRLVAEGFELAPSVLPAGSEADATALVSLCRQLGARAVVVDGYVFGTDFQSRLRGAGLCLLLVDDYHHQPTYHADLLLNQNPGWSTQDYAPLPKEALLLGPRYALIRKEFHTLKNAVHGLHSPPRVLVTLGGGDNRAALCTVLAGLALPKAPCCSATVLTGAVDPKDPLLQQAVQGFTGELKMLSTAPSMPEFLAQADMAISAAGSTCWELCLRGMPALALVLADNQAGIAHRLHELGTLWNLGPAASQTPDKVATALSRLCQSTETIKSMAAAGKALVDSHGARRVCMRLKNVLEHLP